MGYDTKDTVSNNGVLIKKNVPHYKQDDLLFADAVKQNEINIITVTTAKGIWNGDEKSQDRMANAIAQLSRKPLGTIKKWKMADKTKVDVVQADIEEALDLAVEKLDAIIVG